MESKEGLHDSWLQIQVYTPGREIPFLYQISTARRE